MEDGQTKEPTPEEVQMKEVSRGESPHAERVGQEVDIVAFCSTIQPYQSAVSRIVVSMAAAFSTFEPHPFNVSSRIQHFVMAMTSIKICNKKNIQQNIIIQQNPSIVDT